MGLLAIIGGSGFTTLPGLTSDHQAPVTTAYGAPSAPLTWGWLAELAVVFLPRHGAAHHVPPHRINYRANLRALADAGVTEIIALAAVGGIAADCPPGTLCVPDQLIDYTYGRPHTFYEGEDGALEHVDFTAPYSAALRQELLAAAAQANIAVRAGGCYGATQGPRLETAAEIARLERDGCDLVGMTGMPEAALARELGLEYAALAFVVNWAAGKGQGPIHADEIAHHLNLCTATVARWLAALAMNRVRAG